MSTIAIAPQARPVRRTTSQVRRPSSQVRLTRRGRLVVLALAFAVVVAAAVWLAAGSAATREGGGSPAIEVVTVAPGETLWGLASDVAATTGDDVRSVMEQIQQLNTLDSSMVYAGQQLRVPTE
ncbi:MAG: LysM peptidoglycan-binding domain-containing protein [Propionibacteriales bacterium]|nr:LysM peptidoglycan-binding domain-containing protein [Propionibacteriales bacterium]